jgi:hypothetical protein
MRRASPRFNRGRISTVSGGPSPPSPAAQFTADILAATALTNVYLVHGDAGVNQATTSGRVSSLTSQGGANDWTTLGATQEPTYTAADATLGGKGTWATDGSAKYMLNAFNPVAPLTQPYYRVTVVKQNRTLTGRAAVILAAAFGFGIVTDGTTRQTAHSANTTVGPDLDFPVLQWCIVEEYFSGSVSDFTIIGPLDNIVDNFNLGNSNPTSMAMGGSITGSALADSSFAFAFMCQGLPSAPERANIRATIEAYYGSQVVRTRKVCRYFPTGDSITEDVLGTQLWRQAIKDTFFTGLDYPAFSAGSTSSGSFGAEFTRHGGIPGNTIATHSTYLLDPTTGQLRAGGPLTDSIQLLMLMIGTNDMPTYVAGTTAAAYRTLLDGIQAAVPTLRIVVTTIPPQGAGKNNAETILFNAELPAVWDAFDAANPTTPLIRYDANTAVGGPSFVAANFADTLHYNATGSALHGAALVTAIAPIMNTLTTF